MERIRFLTVDEILLIHAAVVQLHGGSRELRDRGLLESAVAMPAARFGGRFLHEDLPAMAAAYLFHLNKNHAFVDGNKRVALPGAETFLVLNGHRIDASNDELVELTLRVADGRTDKAELTMALRERMRELDSIRP